MKYEEGNLFPDMEKTESARKEQIQSFPFDPAISEKDSTILSINLDQLFERLSHSKFRSSFHLNKKDKEYIAKKGMLTIRKHAADFIAKRLAPAVIPNDGKQTPMGHVHPVFIAQHATGCCCRQCFYKWHHIPPSISLSLQQQQYAVNVIMHWIELQVSR